MSISFGTQSSASATGTTSLSVAYPTGIVAGDLLVLPISSKYPTNGPVTPTGWTLLPDAQASGGHGSSGTNTGNVYMTVFFKVADGTESGNLSVSIPSGNAAMARMYRYTSTGAGAWSVAA